MKKIIRHIGMLALALCILTGYILPVHAKDSKKLYFEEQNGTMRWNNVRGDDGNWFMSFTNMVSGGNYQDQLKIENGSKKTYALYMQVIPLQQKKKQDELLELISMTVSTPKKILYKGTASGKDYNNGNLQNVLYLGTYEPGEEEQIQVDLTLDKQVGLEYCDLLTKNDWKFMVTEIPPKENSKNPEPTKTIHPPKTGDTTNIGIYIVIMGCAAVAAIIIRKKYEL